MGAVRGNRGLNLTHARSHTHTHTRTVVIRRRGGEKNNNQTTHISVILFKFRNAFGRYGTNYAVKGDS